MSWMNAINPVAAPAPEPKAGFVGPTPAELDAAADALSARLAKNYRDDFAAKWMVVAQDMADKLRRYGDYASQKQADLATKIIGWAAVKPSAPAAPKPSKSASMSMPATFEVMQRMSKITFSTLTIARKNQDSLCWIKHPSAERVIGKIEDGVAELFTRRIEDANLSLDGIAAALREIEADPIEAAAKYGKMSGTCGCCGRDLTDPASIALGIGPICYTRLAG